VELKLGIQKPLLAELPLMTEILPTDAHFLKLYFDALIKTLPENFYIINKKGVVVACNDSQAQWCGFQKAEELIGKTAYDVTAPSADELAKNNQKVFESGESLLVEERMLKGIEPRVVLLHKAPMKGRSGEIIGLVGISIDITQRKTLEEDLKASKEKAEAANEAKSEFLRNMRHDLRTPFTGIVSLGDHLAQTEPDSKRKAFLEMIGASGTALLNQLNEIFEFLSCTDSQKPILDLFFNPFHMARSVADAFGPVSVEKKLIFKTNFDENLPRKLIGDRIRTEQILMALLSNAFKFTIQGEISFSARFLKLIEPSLINADPENINLPGCWALVEFVISDTGPGIPDEKQEAAFEQFGRLHASYKENKYTGKGFGLSLVKRRMDELGGELTLESIEGKGTEFTLLIPYKLSLLEE